MEPEETPEELLAARALARWVDGERPGEVSDGLLQIAALAQALGPGSDDEEGIERVRRRLERSPRRGIRALGAMLVAAAALLVLTPGEPPVLPGADARLVKIEWPRYRKRMTPAQLAARARPGLAQLSRIRFDRRKPWLPRPARGS